MPPSNRVCKPALAAALLLVALGAAAKEKRLASLHGRFSYAAPKGMSSATVKNAVAGWQNEKDKTTLGVFAVAPERKAQLGSAFKATTASREKAAKKEGDWFVSKVYKKTLESGMPFYFYSAHQKGKLMKVSGYFALGGDYFFVSGWTSRHKHGLPGVYGALSTIRPVSAPHQRRAMEGHKSEELLQRHGKKEPAPGVQLGTGSGTPKLIGSPKMIGAPKRSGGPVN